MRKIFTLLMAIVVSIGVMQAAIYSGTCGDDLTWSLNTDDSTLTIAGSGAMTEWASIRDVPWYDYHYSIVKALTLDEGLTSIGGYAFSNCPLITSIDIPNSVTSIGNHALNGCEGLTSIELPDSVRNIGEYAFGECYYLTSVILPDSITSIANATFENCYRLENIHIPNTVTSIGEVAFYGTGLTSITIPSGVTSIGNLVFCDCPNLTTITCEALVPPVIDDRVCGESFLLYVPGASIKAYKAADGWKDFTNILPIPGTEVSCEPQLFYDTIATCQNDYISWREQYIPTDKPGYYHYSDSLMTIYGCDSIFYLLMIVRPSYNYLTQDTITIEKGDSVIISRGYPWQRIEFPETTTIYGDTMLSVFGCDSMVTHYVIVQEIPATYGKCGDSAYWDLDTISGVLTISGSGAMYDYTDQWHLDRGEIGSLVPWHRHAQYITSSQVQEGITYLGAYTFENNRTIKHVHLPSTLQTLGNMSFYCATNTETITCDALIPPTGGTFKGVNSEAIIYVPCGTKSAYAASDYWGWYFPNIEDGSYEFIQDTIICYGDGLFWRGRYLSYYSDTIVYYIGNSKIYKFGDVFGTYADTLKTIQDCDSIYVLNAYVAPYYYESINDTINEGESHWAAQGKILKDTVLYKQYATYWGCDSIQEWRIYVIPKPYYIISTVVNNSKYGYVEGAGTYPADTTITLTAIPNKGYQFNEWSDGNTDYTRQVTVTQDETFTAIFGVKMCSWFVESNDLEMGAIITDFNEEFYKYGTQITVEASPNSGYKFVKWNDGKKYNPYKFSLLDDKYLLAIFMEEEEEQDTTTVEPTATSATFTWSFIDGGFSYSLTIYLDAACTIPFCTLTFNQYGQLISIHFGSRAPQRLIAQEEGFTYTVSGLDANTEYFFKMETMDEDNKLINTDEGSFTTTNETTDIEIPNMSDIPHKVMINGQILILRGDKTYTLTGQEVK